MDIFAQYDIIVDGTDNFATRYLVNDACVLLKKPYVWGSIYRFDGQASVFWAEYGPLLPMLVSRATTSRNGFHHVQKRSTRSSLAQLSAQSKLLRRSR
jgi:molybdopterin/thiamine biosynthesis adenylyltransferase